MAATNHSMKSFSPWRANPERVRDAPAFIKNRGSPSMLGFGNSRVGRDGRCAVRTSQGAVPAIYERGSGVGRGLGVALGFGVGVGVVGAVIVKPTTACWAELKTQF